MFDVSHVSSVAFMAARRELAQLPRLLKSGEQVVDVCHGVARGRTAVMVLTDRRVVYMRRRPLFGAQIHSAPLSHVRSAEEQIGVREATVTVDAGGRLFELSEVDRALAQTFCARLRARLRDQ